MRIIQFNDPKAGRCLGVVRGEQVYNLTEQNASLTSVYVTFREARRRGKRLEEYLQEVMDGERSSLRSLTLPARRQELSYVELLEAGRVLPPVTEEPDLAPSARLLVSGTGLTHTGSVQQRDQMHQKERGGPATPSPPQSDSSKMFELGLEGGRPASGRRGAAPEWFYKGDGRILRGPGQPLDIPPFAPDGGEEPEVVGIHIIDDEGRPCRLGFAQGNEWSDHVTENINYLYLAPSKLRTCSIGPELVTDLRFEDIRGRCRVLRAGQVIYDSGELLTGEKNMCHSLANMEDHHFKYPQHRIPGDIHVHFFGTSKLSFQHRDWKYQDGDVIEVSFDGLGALLRNPVRRLEMGSEPVRVALG